MDEIIILNKELIKWIYLYNIQDLKEENCIIKFKH